MPYNKGMDTTLLENFFEEVEIEQPHDGYYYEVGDAIIVTILGSICGLKNLKQMHRTESLCTSLPSLYFPIIQILAVSRSVLAAVARWIENTRLTAITAAKP